MSGPVDVLADRKLLKLAAQAAGLLLCPEWDAATDGILIGSGNGDLQAWNPLADDGDALRLAVKLGLNIKSYPIYDSVKHTTIVEKEIPLDDLDCPRATSPFRLCPDCDPAACQKPTKPTAIELHGNDPCAATRRAIVRTAAALANVGGAP